MATLSGTAARSRGVLLAGAVFIAAVRLTPHTRLLADLAAPRAWVSRVGPDRAAAQCAAALLWLVACWAALALLAGVAARLPGLIGSGARRLVVVTVPRGLRPILVAATGAGIVLSPALATAAPRSSDAAPTAHQALAPTPGWPTDDPVPTPAWPTRSAPISAQPAQPTQPPPPTSLPKTQVTPPPASGSRRDTHVVIVRPGDSLWSIAAAHERSAASSTTSTSPAAPAPAARIARAWPSWFAANRAVIGDDPNLIRPGERLRMPTADHTTTHRTAQGGQP